ncbi:MAG TPA: histidinol-phosphatase HisJ family protein [Candidatus Merdivicinus excrementipullorum]|mgnify:FL=1|uniref:Histidinol-phosphatase n=1 Tax=Candidatus Merdivicinus excrementipullorum TaxID=2840867 RepID=A0A9D1FPF0_9FIRM|nr:histidinol-phosphatase HisJ family protein [Candidatus Merdivicinus excrementipullorum]
MAKIIADYHMHTTFSPDGFDSPEAMCRAALEKGLTEIAVTDHFEFYQAGIFKDKPFTIENMLAQQRELDKCREMFSGKLTIRSGIEIGQPQCNPQAASELMASVSFDYVIGSVHKLHDLDLGLTEYPDEKIPGLVEQNLTMLYDLADKEDFDCLGHLDIIKRYAANKGKQIDLMDYKDQLEPILRRVAERGKGLEINTSGLRQAARETLPSVKVLEFYRALGGEILTIGSDAHKTGDVAAGFAGALEAAQAAGFRYLALYENRTPHFYPIG